jgi:hypothetical protein
MQPNRGQPHHAYRSRVPIWPNEKAICKYCETRSRQRQQCLYLTQQSEGSPFSPIIYDKCKPERQQHSGAGICQRCKVYFNTLLNFSSYNSSALYQSGGVSALQFINNLCTATNGKAACAAKTRHHHNLDHNLFQHSLAETPY